MLEKQVKKVDFLTPKGPSKAPKAVKPDLAGERKALLVHLLVSSNAALGYP